MAKNIDSGIVDGLTLGSKVRNFGLYTETSRPLQPSDGRPTTSSDGHSLWTAIVLGRPLSFGRPSSDVLVGPEDKL